MRKVASVLAIAMYLGALGCEERGEQVVESRPSPDGQRVLWVTNEYGGLASGVVRVHVTRRDQAPVDRTIVLQTPECSAAMVDWVDSMTVAVVYDSLDLNRFSSDALDDDVHVVLIDRRTRSGRDVRPADGIALPCDPY